MKPLPYSCTEQRTVIFTLSNDLLNVSTDDNEMTYKKASQILSSLIDDTLINTDKINDFTEGSISRTLYEAEATELEMLYYLTRENMKTAIDKSVLTSFGFEPKKATYAYGNVRVSFNNPLANTIYLPKGTIFTSSQDIYDQRYTTTDEYKIPKGTGAFEVPVYCTETGTYGNVPEGVIDTTSSMSGISEVTNPQSFLTGTDDETSADMKVRFRDMLQALNRGTTQSLKNAVMNVEGIAGCYVYESTYGAVGIYCHDNNGDLSTDLQKAVANALVDWRPAGIRVYVFPTHKSIVQAQIGISVSDIGLEDPNFLTMVKQKIEAYINSLSVGVSIYKSDLIQKVMDISDLGIVNCTMDLSVTPDEALLDKQYIGDDTVINVKGVEVNQKYLRAPDITNDATYGMVGVTNTNIDDSGKVSYKDANVIKNGTTTTLDPVEVTDHYNTNPNEILRAGTITVNLLTTNDTTLDNNDTGK